MALVNLLALEPNVPKANLSDYIYLLYGRPKVGKTTFFNLLMKEAFPDNPRAGLLFAFEEGFKALRGIVAQKVDEWDDFLDAIDQLIDNREQMPFEMLAFDTVDRMYAMCTAYILRKLSAKDNAVYKTANDVPWGKGFAAIASEMEEQITRLQKAGYGLFFITHDQDKKIEERSGLSYDKTVVSLDKRARDIVVNMADFIMFIENIAEKAKGDKIINNRYIFLRADGSIEAGSRFTNIVERVPYDARAFLNAFEDAVIDAHEEDVDLDELKEQQKAEKDAQAQEYVEKDKAGREETQQEDEKMSVEEFHDAITKRLKEISVAGRKQFKAECKELANTENVKRVDDPAILDELLNIANKLQ